MPRLGRASLVVPCHVRASLLLDSRSDLGCQTVTYNFDQPWSTDLCASTSPLRFTQSRLCKGVDSVLVPEDLRLNVQRFLDRFDWFGKGELRWYQVYGKGRLLMKFS